MFKIIRSKMLNYIDNYYQLLYTTDVDPKVFVLCQ